MRVLAAAADADSLITQIRVATPLQAVLARAGGTLRLESYPFIRLADLAGADLLVAQRGMAPRHLQLMQALRARGGAVIYEIDDLLIEPAPHLLHHQALTRARPWVLQCLAAAHVVTASTARLAQALAPYTSQIEIVPNCAHPVRNAPWALPKQEAGAPATVLLASSDNFAATALYPALRALVAERGAALQIVGVGHAGTAAAAAGLPVQQHPLMSRAEFSALAQRLPNAVAAIPLDNSPFSACKSAIKWFDFAEAGLPTVASNVPPYADVIDDGRTAWLVADEEAAWYQALTRALDDTAQRAAVARSARERVRTHHNAALTEAAWAAALERVMALRDTAPSPPGLWAAWRSDITHQLDTAAVSLRRFNRRRLDRRRLRTATS